VLNWRILLPKAFFTRNGLVEGKWNLKKKKDVWEVATPNPHLQILLNVFHHLSYASKVSGYNQYFLLP
jgi:hypothetical protein